MVEETQLTRLYQREVHVIRLAIDALESWWLLDVQELLTNSDNKRCCVFIAARSVTEQSENVCKFMLSRNRNATVYLTVSNMAKAGGHFDLCQKN